jgi:hypothetical protein
MSNVHEFAIPLLQQSLIEFGVTVVAAVTVSTGALAYFRRVRMERPPVGTFNGRDIGTLLALIIALPFLYAIMPGWLLTCFLAMTFAAALSIGYRPVFGAGPVWLGIGLLVGANIWESHTMMGSVIGWQVWWVELDILVLFAAVAVANLYVQGGMRLHGIGIGDLLFYALFVIASYKAYGRAAARLALSVMVVFGAAAPSLFPLVVTLIDFRNDILIPSQLFFAPAAFLCYLWMKHRYGRERTMAEYWASTDGTADSGAVARHDPAPEPASV